LRIGVLPCFKRFRQKMCCTFPDIHFMKNYNKTGF